MSNVYSFPSSLFLPFKLKLLQLCVQFDFVNTHFSHMWYGHKFEDVITQLIKNATFLFF